MPGSDLAVEDGLWTAVDVARFLRVSRSWVYQRAQAGLLPSVKLGGALRFEPAAIRAYVASGRGPDVPPAR
jgi:excisionase family DNA binding protein